MPLLDREAGGKEGLFGFGGVCDIVDVVVGEARVAMLRASAVGVDAGLAELCCNTPCFVESAVWSCQSRKGSFPRSTNLKAGNLDGLCVSRRWENSSSRGESTCDIIASVSKPCAFSQPELRLSAYARAWERGY